MSKYFTAVRSTIHINSVFADEIFAVSYQETSNTIPVYGYASRKFDAVVRGKSIIEGTIFVYHNRHKYFWVLLAEAMLDTANLTGFTTDEISKNEQKIQEMAASLRQKSETDVIKELDAFLEANAGENMDFLIPQIQRAFNNELNAIRPPNNSRKAYGDATMDKLSQIVGTASSAARLTEVDLAGPFTLKIQTGSVSSGGSQQKYNPVLIDGVIDCFITGKSTDIVNDDRILYKAYTFFGREELK